ncbi:MAG: CBS domain-containing protein [Sphingomonadaceae bacterium]
MTIARLLATRNGEIISVSRGTPVSEAVALLADRRIGAVPVLDGDAIIGIMSERDVIYRLRSDGAAILDWPVERVMTSPVHTVEPDNTLIGALAQMTRRRIRHLPVVEGGRMVGIVSIGDLVKARIDKIEGEAQAMREYIQSA